MSETKKIIGENVKNYLEAKGIKNNWIIERLGISKGAFYNFLKGEGNVDLYEQKILKLFRIKDPFYFHRNEIELPKSIKEKNQEQNFMDFAALSFFGEDNKEFRDGMKTFRGFVELVDILKSVSSSSPILEGEYLDNQR